jgi:tetratricopeptide (TPR) repeat protein
VVKTQDWRILAVYEARKALEGNPDLPKNIYNLAEALSDLETDEGDAEAVKLLEEAYAEQSNFSFQEKAGKLRIKHIRRKLQQFKAALEKAPNDAQIQAQMAQAKEQLDDLELAHYRDCVKNYPTDRRFKYELAQRLAQNKQYDEAIPLFQEARKDPARKQQSMNHIGLCFFHKGWMNDAIDVFSQALEEREVKDDSMGKELRYNLARAYEAQGSAENALDIYRKIAQSDFTYRDVSERVQRLRQEEDQN